MVRFARTVSRRLDHSAAAPVLRLRAVAYLRKRLFVVRSEDVLEVLDVLDAAGVQAWLAGGWGIDALLGEQTRTHHDVDVIVGDTDESVARSLRALASLGLDEFVEGAVQGKHLPKPIRLRDDRGRFIDLIPVELSMLPFTAVDPAIAPDHGDGVAHLFAVGTIEGRPVPCLSVGSQVAQHRGFKLKPHQQRDFAALCRRFDRSSRASPASER